MDQNNTAKEKKLREHGNFKGVSMHISNRSKALTFSPNRKFNGVAQAVEESGTKIIRMNIGQPDLPTPRVFFDAISNADVDVLGYANSQGITEMIEAQKAYYANKGLDYKGSEIFVTNGAIEALQIALTSVCDPGDAILCIEPYYTNYSLYTTMFNVDIQVVSSKIEENYKVPSKEVFEQAITDKTRAILLSNPGNPTGRVLMREEMNILVEVAKEHDLYIFADEVYREFNFTDRPFISFAEYDDLEQNLILFDSVSKKYAACGARIGTLATKNPDLQVAFNKAVQARLAASTMDQIGAAAFSQLDDTYHESVRNEYRIRKQAIFEGLSEIPDITFSHPEGAFYTLVQLPVEDADDFVSWTLQNYQEDGTTILTSPAAPFYQTPGIGENEIRISYALHVDKIRIAMRILKGAIKAYQNK